MIAFADLALARRLEGAEGYACAMSAEARRRVTPGGASAWMRYGGGYVVFDGANSPVTQTFGLGIFEQLTPATLETTEEFFRVRGAPVQHEVCPLAGVDAIGLLCKRGYRPMEISSVLYQPVRTSAAQDSRPALRTRAIEANEAETWTRVSQRGWAADHPELADFLLELGRIFMAREDLTCFLAEIDGEPGAAAALSIHDGVALFAGAATVPEFRRRGLQAALLAARMRCAAERGCDLAMMVAEAGSGSQRNAERQGFRVAYTRTKWRLASSGPV